MESSLLMNSVVTSIQGIVLIIRTLQFLRRKRERVSQTNESTLFPFINIGFLLQIVIFILQIIRNR